MTVGAADLHKAVTTLWNQTNLDWEHKKFWEEAQRDTYPSLHDGQAGPGQPAPYTVFSQSPGVITNRMSSATSDININRAIHDVPWEFRVHAKNTDSVTAKQIGSDIRDIIMGIFGGHPSINPTDLVLDNGCFLISQYQTDFGMRTEDLNYMWTISYIFKLDIPIAI